MSVPPGPSDAVVIDLGRRGARVLGTAAVALVLVGGGIAWVAATDAGATDGTGVRIAMVGVGALLLLFGVLCGVVAVKGRHAGLVVDGDGIAWRGANGAWRLRWDEIERAGVSALDWKAHRTQPIPVREKMVRLVLQLPPAVAATARPGLRAGDEPEPWTHRVTLGTAKGVAEQLDAGLRRFAGERYGGLVERGVWRRRYS
ncbi:hypothetical protein [Patulibacter sp. SYSU D01012]|uniref:hypothetical protein n=1 Tax=Patulibacter sp. SYSU D01012 TaxID=2817381 RepID=UPI001B3068B8|nr:hypothetical protein [Patulibacter sp. SYSU D01012]